MNLLFVIDFVGIVNKINGYKNVTIINQNSYLSKIFSILLLGSVSAGNLFGVNRYVDINSTNPVAPYTSWATASTNIQSAIDVAADDDVVLITNGVYSPSAEIVVNSDIIIKGVGGPDVTTVDGGGTHRCFNLGSAACVISGLTIKNGFITNSNPQQASGGGIYCVDTMPVISNCVFVDNNAYIGGGLIFGTVYDTSFLSNRAEFGGGFAGGIAYNCLFEDNTAYVTNNNNPYGNGGAVYGAKIYNCILKNNTASGVYGNGGGMGGGSASSVAYNCLFIGNSATGAVGYGNGGGAYDITANNCTFFGCTATGDGGGVFDGDIRNSIVWYNTASNNENDIAGDASVRYSCSPDVNNGVDGNITNEPSFKNKFTGNVRLRGGSACADAGTNLYVVGDYDLDGVIRIVNGIVDMGAYELVTVHYVDSTGSNAVTPYATWDTAATDIQSAVNVSADGDTVMVSNGVYRPAAEIVVTNAITIASANGADFVTVNGGGTHRCFNLGASDCVISGLTVTNGYIDSSQAVDPDGGGIYCSSTNPVIRHCVIAGNQAGQSGGGIYGGTAENTIFYGNSASDGGGLANGVAVNCTAVDNIVSGSGGGIYNSAVYNTISIYNSADYNYDNIAYCVVSNTCSPDAPGGSGNITAAPLFVDYPAGNLRLSHNSPCVDAGNNALISWGMDMDGVLRIANNTVDMGAYELVAIHFVDKNGTNPVSPYGSWDTAATNIQDAVDVAVDDDTVKIASGVYGLTSEIVVSNNITVTGNGEDTVLDGNGQYRVFNLGTSSCFIVAMTITNGYAAGGSFYEKRGGGIFCENTLPVISNVIFSGNSALEYGGGLYYGTAVDCVFSYNCADNGGGIYGGVAERCSFYNNSASDQGGGISYGVSKQCYFVGNRANEGGGIYEGSSISSCFAGNIADADGGAVHSGLLRNCTITGNSAIFSGGGVYSSVLTNCIVWYNDAGNSDANIADSSVAYTCSPDVTNGVSGNITNVPLMASSSHLQNNSPCIGAGINLALSNNRDIDNEHWYNPPSMGCDEYLSYVFGDIQPILNIPPIISWHRDISVQSIVPGAASEFTVSFGDGVAVTNKLLATHSWGNTGIYSVVLTAYNNDYPGGVAVTQQVSIVFDTQYVSKAGSDTNDGWSILYPKATIQAAVDAVGYGGGVSIAAGTFYPQAEIVVDKDITISGAGVENTAVYADKLHRCFNLGATKTELSGMVIADGVVTNINGGGIYCVNRAPIIKDCRFINCETDKKGGAVYYGTLTNCVLSGNIAKFGGAAAYSKIIDCTVSNNTARYGFGGAVYRGDSYNSVIINNKAVYDGGGLYGGSATDCSIAGNSAANGGGAYDSIIIRGKLSGNRSSQNGGGIYGGSVDSAAIDNNDAVLGGGGYDTEVYNSVLFDNNASDSGGGLYNSTANNCNLIANNAVYYGGGIAWGTINNTISWYNKAGVDGDDVFSTTAHYSCSPDITASSGNINDEPVLASPSHLAVGSPCIGAGSVTYISGTDIDDESWKTPPSIGCDEFSSTTAGTPDMTLDISSRIAVNANVPVYYNVSGAAVSSTILSFGDGTYETNLPVTVHSWSVPGTYSVELTAYNNDYPGGISVTCPVDVVAGDRFVAVSGSDTNNGDSWATAKQTIQAAIDSIDAYGGRVLVSNGIYHLSTGIVVSNDISILGVNGADTTYVDAGSTNRCFNLGDYSCMISGLTLTNGYSGNKGGGVYCINRIPLISNCVVSGNSAVDQGGGIYGGTVLDTVFTGNDSDSGGGLSYGTAYRCVFKNNDAQQAGGGVYFSTVNNSLLVRNDSQDIGGGADESDINNCTIAGNSAATAGGGIYGGSAKNCIVWYNTVSNSAANLYSVDVNSSCSPDVTDGVAGNITNAPAFIDMAGDNYHLNTWSPCIDGGDNSFITGNYDLDKMYLPLDGNADGSAVVDMGCYEQMNSQADSDNDGMPDGWENTYFGSPVAGVDTADNDTDYSDNYSEYIAGTDPTDGSSVFAVSNITTDSGYVLNWNSVSGRVYTVFWNNNLLTNDFSILTTNIYYPVNSYTDTVHSVESVGFYRLGVEMQ